MENKEFIKYIDGDGAIGYVRADKMIQVAAKGVDKLFVTDNGNVWSLTRFVGFTSLEDVIKDHLVRRKV